MTGGPGRPAPHGGGLVVGFDAIRALRNRTGLGNYSRGVLRALRAADPSLDIHLYSPLPPLAEFAGLAGEIAAQLHLPARPPSGRVIGSLWREFRAGRAAARDGVQLYHGLSHVMPRDLPATGIPAVVTFADLIVEETPRLFRRFDRWSYRRRFRWSARNAAALVAISSVTRDALVTRYRIDPGRITVIPPPRDPRFAVPPTDADLARVRTRYRLPERYALSVGTLETRKNHRVLIAAIAAARGAASLPLVIAGHDGGEEDALRREAAQLGVADRIRIETALAAEDLPAVMHQAAVFLYPSRREGFGMPIVEALSAGVPVLAASGGHLDEAGGPAARYLDPDDPNAWAAAIGEISGDPAAAAGIRAAGLRWASRFDAERIADPLLSLYRRTVAGG